MTFGRIFSAGVLIGGCIVLLLSTKAPFVIEALSDAGATVGVCALMTGSDLRGERKSLIGGRVVEERCDVM